MSSDPKPNNHISTHSPNNTSPHINSFSPHPKILSNTIFDPITHQNFPSTTTHQKARRSHPNHFTLKFSIVQ